MLAVALVSFVFYGVKIYMTHYEQPPKFEPTDIVLYVQGCVLCVCELWFPHARVMPGHAKIGEAVSAIRHSKMHPASNAEATTVRTPTRGVDKRARAAHAPAAVSHPRFLSCHTSTAPSGPAFGQWRCHRARRLAPCACSPHLLWHVRPTPQLSTMGKSDPVDIKRNVYEDDDDLPDDASSGYHTPGGYATPVSALPSAALTPPRCREPSPRPRRALTMNATRRVQGSPLTWPLPVPLVPCGRRHCPTPSPTCTAPRKAPASLHRRSSTTAAPSRSSPSRIPPWSVPADAVFAGPNRGGGGGGACFGGGLARRAVWRRRARIGAPAVRKLRRASQHPSCPALLA